ncbi:MAG: hypothetical protein AB1696_15860 [Planctomycetota bacterium]
MSARLSPRFRLHLRWLVLTVAIGLLCVGMYGNVAARERPGGAPEGIILGALAAAVMVFASCYGVRRGLGLKRLRDTVGRIDPDREKRLADLNERIADLQIAGHKEGGMAANLLRAARAAVKKAGFARQMRVEILMDRGRPVLRLVPREHPGRLENWLLAHQYLGILVVVLLALHAGFRFRGTLAVATTALAIATVGSGLIVSLLYVIGPRILVRMEAAKGSDGAHAAILTGTITAALALHVALTGALLAALLVHVLSILHY